MDRRKLNPEEIKMLANSWQIGVMEGDDVEPLHEYLGWTEAEMARWQESGELPS
jgi:hypothetical protein